MRAFRQVAIGSGRLPAYPAGPSEAFPEQCPYGKGEPGVTPMAGNAGRYQRIAALYDLLDWPFELMRYRALRPLLFRGLSGRLLDAGVGTGRNLPFYPPGAKVIGIDFSPRMLARAERRRRRSPATVELKQMDVTKLDFADGTFDAAVATFVFCVLPDEHQAPALRELGRVVKPGGSIRCLEYVRPQGAIRRVVSRIWEPWMAFAYGASFDRQTEKHVAETDLALIDARFVVDDLVKLISVRTAPRAG